MNQVANTKHGWERVLFVALFWVIFYVSQIVIAAVVVGQCLFMLIGGKPNDHLTQLGDKLSQYINEILRFMTFNSDQKPFPFSDFPKSVIVIHPESDSKA